MNKVGIVTIFDNNNYGNRLQNYAVYNVLNKLNQENTTILNDVTINNRELKKNEYIKMKLKIYYRKFKSVVKIIIKNDQRYRLFLKFNKNIKLSKKYFSFFRLKDLKKYDYFICGSDQVWNPNFSRLRDFDLLKFAPENKRIAFSASFRNK